MAIQNASFFFLSAFQHSLDAQSSYIRVRSFNQAGIPAGIGITIYLLRHETFLGPRQGHLNGRSQGSGGHVTMSPLVKERKMDF